MFIGMKIMEKSKKSLLFFDGLFPIAWLTNAIIQMMSDDGSTLLATLFGLVGLMYLCIAFFKFLARKDKTIAYEKEQIAQEREKSLAQSFKVGRDFFKMSLEKEVNKIK